jgi:hypothetical protein
VGSLAHAVQAAAGRFGFSASGAGAGDDGDEGHVQHIKVS